MLLNIKSIIITLITKLNKHIIILLTTLLILIFINLKLQSFYIQRLYKINSKRDSVQYNISKETCNAKPYVNQSKYKVIGEERIEDHDLIQRIKYSIGEYDSKEKYGLINRNIIKIIQNETTNKIAYIEESYENNGKETRKVYIKDITGNNETLVYKLTETTLKEDFADGPFRLVIVDIGFSQNGSLLGITTTESLLVYNLRTKGLKKIFEKKKDFSEKNWGVLSYDEPLFSPDNKSIILYTGHYEGNGAVLISLVDLSVIELPYFQYHEGESVIGWYKNRIVVGKTESKFIKEELREDTYTKIYLVSVPSLQEEYIGKIKGFFLVDIR